MINGQEPNAGRSDEGKVHIVGIGDDGLQGLSHRAQALLADADCVIGSPRALQAVADVAGEPRTLSGDPEEVVRVLLELAGRRVVLLASGDPLFYGTARYLCDRLGDDRFEVVPHVSSMQLAFARVKETWDEAYLTNLANQPVDQVIERIRSALRVGIFTTEQITPDALAARLLAKGIDYFSAFVCENLGSPDERVTRGDLAEIAAQRFGPLNVLILVRQPDAPDRPREMLGHRLFGNPDELFLQSRPKRGLLTPAEVRCVALAEMDLGPSSTAWDVGAGSGSISIEAAQLAHSGHVYAIEMDAQDHLLISANAERFGVRNLTAVLGRAPEAWDELPDPDSIFVGGTGREVSNIVQQALLRLRPAGRLVVNVASLESAAAVRSVLGNELPDSHFRMVQITRGTPQLDSLRLESSRPTFLLSAVMPPRLPADRPTIAPETPK